MTWEPELEELRDREALAEQLGGAEKVERQHHFGKQTVRERVEQIVDDGSFWELGKTAGVAQYDEHGNLVEFTPSNFVFGIAELDGRPAVVSGDDFTVRGGSNDASISAKREASESIAAEMRLPHVRLLDVGNLRKVEHPPHRDLECPVPRRPDVRSTVSEQQIAGSRPWPDPSDLNESLHRSSIVQVVDRSQVD